jgi:hypothetical protein
MLEIELFGAVLRTQSTMSRNVHHVLTASGKVTSVTEIREPWMPTNPPPNFLPGRDYVVNEFWVLKGSAEPDVSQPELGTRPFGRALACLLGLAGRLVAHRCFWVSIGRDLPHCNVVDN